MQWILYRNYIHVNIYIYICFSFWGCLQIGAKVQDNETKEEFIIRAKVVVNCTGQNPNNLNPKPP